MSSMSQSHQDFGAKRHGHIWSTKAPKSALASPTLTFLHPASGTEATPAAAGTLLQASTWGHEPGITYKPQELPYTPGLGKQRGGENFVRQGKQRSLINE